MALSPGFDVLLIARSLAGVSALGVVPVVFSLLADLYPAEERGRGLTAVIVGQNMGNSSAFALGGALLAATDHAVGWRWAMTWLVVPVALATFLMLAVRNRRVRVHRGPASSAADVAGTEPVSGDRRLIGERDRTDRNGPWRHLDLERAHDGPSP